MTTIAIDGPAAAGKSTIGERLAQQLGYLYFDTGLMYRAITFLALEGGYDLSDDQALGKLAETTHIEIEPPAPDITDGRQVTVRVGGQDITWQIRTPRVNAHVSEVAAHPRVRSTLKEQQRRIGQRGQVVMVGRDIGTVVMPDASLKIYLDASVEERTRRRYEEMLQQGQSVSLDSLLDAMRKRDKRDSTRATAPLRVASDAHILNSDGKSIEDVMAIILKWYNPT